MSGLMQKSSRSQSRKKVQGIYMQVMLVFLLFFLMVLSTGLFIGRTLNIRFKQNAEDAINGIQRIISSALLMPELPLNYISENIQNMLWRGESLEAIKVYMAECVSQEYKERMLNFPLHSIYGYFYDYDVFYSGRGWTPTEADNFIVKERPWYIAAVAANGKTAIVSPYIDANSRTAVIAYSRLLTDERGQPIAVVGIDVPLNYLEGYIITRHITENGFGWLMDENLVFIIHENVDFLGKSMYEMSTFNEIVIELEHNYEVSKAEFISYKEQPSFMFSRQLDNGWFVGLIVPKIDYYKDMKIMMLVVSTLGILMAAILSAILVGLDRAKHRANIENQQKSDFLATMSHEIRTPMNTIMGITEMQLHEEWLSKNTREAFDRIHYSGDLLLSIINDLLDLSKIEAGKLEIKPVRYEVASLIDEIIQLNRLRFASSPLEFKLRVGENVPETLIGDELRIKQVLNNLLSNAFKYTDKGEVELSVTADTEEDGNVTLVFAVRDTGQGMSAEQVSMLFDRFIRFNMEKNRTIEGTGLGMSITYSLVNMMNGSINVESQLEKGSTFTVIFPQKLNGKADGSHAVISREMVENLAKKRVVSSVQVKKARIIRKYMPYGSVLVVDDTEANLYVAKLLMSPYGLKIDTADSGYEAIDKIKNGNVYDVVFMDHMMPVIDGIEAVKIIRELQYLHPIIALTANAIVGQADIFLENGFDDFISKPIDMRLMDVMLNKYIHDKQMPDVLAAAELEREKIESQLKVRQACDMETLPNISGLNTGRGLALFDGDIETYLSALRSYTKSVPETLEKLRIVTEETLPEYAVNVHGLKSISGWISADGIQARAASLEALAKAGVFAGVTALNDILLNETENFINELLEEVGNN
ncbi:MAG: response regulator [Treponema sp.]|jgi:signal transduction histidine kinase/FixJ family two-component response regulator/HPt (histidine-containing phosphotransfer) domain-containing protein|nr:response regulator [Treponema sp.]